MNRDAIDPCLQTGFAMEVLHPPEHFQEDFLRGIRGVGGIVHHSVNQAIDGLMKFADQRGIGFFRPSFEFGNNSRFLGSDSDRAGEIAQAGGSRQSGHGVTPIIGSFWPRDTTQILPASKGFWNAKLVLTPI